MYAHSSPHRNKDAILARELELEARNFDAAAPVATASSDDGLSELETLFGRELDDEEVEFMKYVVHSSIHLFLFLADTNIVRRALEARLGLGSLGSLLGKGATEVAGKGASAAEAGAVSGIGKTIKSGLVSGVGSAVGGTIISDLLGGGGSSSSSSSAAAAAAAASATGSAAAPAASTSTTSGGGILSDIESLFRRESSIDELD